MKTKNEEIHGSMLSAMLSEACNILGAQNTILLNESGEKGRVVFVYNPKQFVEKEDSKDRLKFRLTVTKKILSEDPEEPSIDTLLIKRELDLSNRSKSQRTSDKVALMQSVALTLMTHGLTFVDLSMTHEVKEELKEDEDTATDK